MVGRDAEGDPGVADLPLRAHEPLRHRRLRDEEGAGDLLERDRTRFLKGVLGELEVAEDADQAREDAPPFGTKDALDLVQCSTTGLTSTEPPCRAAGIFEANSIASSRLSHSMR